MIPPRGTVLLGTLGLLSEELWELTHRRVLSESELSELAKRLETDDDPWGLFCSHVRELRREGAFILSTIQKNPIHESLREDFSFVRFLPIVEKLDACLSVVLDRRSREVLVFLDKWEILRWAMTTILSAQTGGCMPSLRRWVPSTNEELHVWGQKLAEWQGMIGFVIGRLHNYRTRLDMAARRPSPAEVQLVVGRYTADRMEGTAEEEVFADLVRSRISIDTKKEIGKLIDRAVSELETLSELLESAAPSIIRWYLGPYTTRPVNFVLNNIPWIEVLGSLIPFCLDPSEETLSFRWDFLGLITYYELGANQDSQEAMMPNRGGRPY